MLTVGDYRRIRRAHRDEMGIREITRRFHHSRQKVRQIPRSETKPQPYAKRLRQRAPKLGRFRLGFWKARLRHFQTCYSAELALCTQNSVP
jgi:hypothetical protein